MDAGHIFLVFTRDHLQKALLSQQVDELQVSDKVLCAYKSWIKNKMFFFMFSYMMSLVSLGFQLESKFYPEKNAGVK